MITVKAAEVSLTKWFIYNKDNICKLPNLADLGRWNIALLASINARSILSRHRLIHAPSMELLTACAKSDFPSRR